MFRRTLLQLYRLAILVAIAWIVRAHYVRLRIEGNAPITLTEVRAVFPMATELRPDASERAGMFVWDDAGHQLGYVLRTAPISDGIVGYRGWTDTLVAFDPALHVVGVRIRSSQDTEEHVGDVRDDRYFMKTWNGKPWDQVARTTPEEAGIEGVVPDRPCEEGCREPQEAGTRCLRQGIQEGGRRAESRRQVATR